MAVRKVLTDPDPILRKKARKVEQVDAFIQSILEDMAETMYAHQGVGLAAPQIGIGKRLVVIDAGEGLLKLVNPKIQAAEGREIKIEACLSVPNLCGKVERFMRVTVKALDENGKTIKITGDELLGHALQHELDHLDGILFTDLTEEIFAREEESEEAAENREETPPPEAPKAKTRRAKTPPPPPPFLQNS